jgi:hypothetical protein
MRVANSIDSVVSSTKSRAASDTDVLLLVDPAHMVCFETRPNARPPPHPRRPVRVALTGVEAEQLWVARREQAFAAVRQEQAWPRRGSR